MSKAPYDPRAVANLLLDLANSDGEGGLAITHVALQKLLYFAHGHFLIRTGKPLVTGAFEAWTYGPVHPGVYREFQGVGRHPITTRATSYDVMTGETRSLPIPDDAEVRQQLRQVLNAYGGLSAARLIEISHAPRGPWATVVNKAQTSVALGMRIPDSVTIECFRFQKVSVGVHSRVGEPNEDTPIVRN